MFEFPARRHLIVLRQMVAVIIIKQWFFCSQISPKGIVEIIVASMKRYTIQNGGPQKIQVSKKLIFGSNVWFTKCFYEVYVDKF